MNVVLNCPECEINQIIDFVDEISTHIKDDEVTLDFSSIMYVNPFSTLILAESIRDFVQKRKKMNLKTSEIKQISTEAINYLNILDLLNL